MVVDSIHCHITFIPIPLTPVTALFPLILNCPSSTTGVVRVSLVPEDMAIEMMMDFPSCLFLFTLVHLSWLALMFWGKLCILCSFLGFLHFLNGSVRLMCGLHSVLCWNLHLILFLKNPAFCIIRSSCAVVWLYVLSASGPFVGYGIVSLVLTPPWHYIDVGGSEWYIFASVGCLCCYRFFWL